MKNAVRDCTFVNNALQQPEAPALDNILNDIRRVAERIAGSVGSLESFNDRLLGSVPQEVSKDHPVPVPSGRLDEMHEAVARCFALLRDLDDQMHRLGKVA